LPTVKSHSGSRGGGKKGELHRISIEKASNGFTVKAHRRPVPGDEKSYMMEHDQPGAVFTKHAPAAKHIKSLMSEMMPPALPKRLTRWPSNTAGGETGMVLLWPNWGIADDRPGILEVTRVCTSWRSGWWRGR